MYRSEDVAMEGSRMSCNSCQSFCGSDSTCRRVHCSGCGMYGRSEEEAMEGSRYKWKRNPGGAVFHGGAGGRVEDVAEEGARYKWKRNPGGAVFHGGAGGRDVYAE